MRAKWRREFKVALEADTWGQIEEAREGYERLAAGIKQVHDDAPFRLAAAEKGLLLKLASALTVRAREVHDDLDLGVGSHGVQQLQDAFDGVLINPNPPRFPFELPNAAVTMLSDMQATPSRGDVSGAEGGSLLSPVVLRQRGQCSLSIFVEKWGFKDATAFIDPFVTISVLDKSGGLLENQQDTPPCNRNKPNYVLFGNTVHIQTLTAKLKPGSAIIFEFKHFKPKKKKVSTKAWALMEYDEFINNDRSKLALEIYEKPTDFKRKRLNLLSVKPLYLHIELARRTLDAN